MRNRFNSREVLCDGIGFNPSIGGFDGVKPTNVSSAKGITQAPTEVIASIKDLANPFLTGEGLEVSSNILRSLDLVQS
ncbi:MAG: hypothetical protein VKK32_05600 [Candidatus Melainabacteria bacterium]|nr:hypothetical protein [Candidatus Melainabacteria bacterium]